MVQFPGCPLHTLWIQMWMAGRQTGRVTPFGYPRISGCVLLPAAFRSLPRPSSYSSSKASTMDPFSLDHIFSCSSSFAHRESSPLPRHTPPLLLFVPNPARSGFRALSTGNCRNCSGNAFHPPAFQPARVPHPRFTASPSLRITVPQRPSPFPN